MKLEEGMYCYNKANRKLGIGKIINFQNNNNANIRYKNDIALISIGNIIASHNIIDLIEIGDYVNSYKITYIDDCDDWKDEKLLYFEEPVDYVIKVFDEKDIKSIVTHEQFESMAYKVGD